MTNGKLPHELVYVEIRDYETIGRSIKEMWVRGAPAIGAAAGFGMALAAMESNASTRDEFIRELERVGDELHATRPTAVNLGWAIKRILNKIARGKFVGQ